jgi:hypothetical protein
MSTTSSTLHITTTNLPKKLHYTFFITTSERREIKKKGGGRRNDKCSSIVVVVVVLLKDQLVFRSHVTTHTLQRNTTHPLMLLKTRTHCQQLWIFCGVGGLGWMDGWLGTTPRMKRNREARCGGKMLGWGGDDGR